MKGRINEVFKSVQGEGPFAGEKQVFVRLFGCNLSCRFCDTPLKGFSEYDPQQLFDTIKAHNQESHSVSFTGGEPLLQKDFLREVLKLTAQAGFKNYLETNGTLFYELRDVIDLVDVVAMDFKLSSSAGMGDLWWMHRRFLEVAAKKEVFVKAVICESTSDDDLARALQTIKEVKRDAILVLQPNCREAGPQLQDKLERFKKRSEEEGVNAHIILQMHKVWGVK
ncbi:MAG: 7-carboxy-7-deazaguanine synthase QueE [Candidatus Omnitrophica bacterium]|nr:7-carboxy-7-deazaguanine synthase QueE [Candidatus Omnitrophota bacterium]